MKNSLLKTAILSLLIVFGFGTLQAQNNAYTGKTFVIENTTSDVAKDAASGSHTLTFQLGAFANQADVDAFTVAMASYSGISTVTVSPTINSGTRTGTLVVDNSLKHRGLVKYLHAAGIEYMWVNDLKAPIGQYIEMRAEAKRNK